ncbi:MAG: hypothetical protein IPP40_15770, partial [bacterium]|nr:hypothetical protein [bacterium]
KVTILKIGGLILLIVLYGGLRSKQTESFSTDDGNVPLIMLRVIIGAIVFVLIWIVGPHLF